MIATLTSDIVGTRYVTIVLGSEGGTSSGGASGCADSSISSSLGDGIGGVPLLVVIGAGVGIKCESIGSGLVGPIVDGCECGVLGGDAGAGVVFIVSTPWA